MSFTQSRLRGSTSVRPAQVFKKRYKRFDNQIASGATSANIAIISLEETGTIYSVKIDIQGLHLSGTTGDMQKIQLYVACKPAGTPQVNMNTEINLETMNGFYVGSLNMANGSNEGFRTGLTEKFRFRRKCDRNTEVILIGVSQIVNGTGRVVDMTGLMTIVVRVK